MHLRHDPTEIGDDQEDPQGGNKRQDTLGVLRQHITDRLVDGADDPLTDDLEWTRIQSYAVCDIPRESREQEHDPPGGHDRGGNNEWADVKHRRRKHHWLPVRYSFTRR